MTRDTESDWQTYAGISVVAIAAAVMSFAAWFELGTLVGITQIIIIGGVTLYLAWLLPLSVDVYAVTTARVWLRSTTASEGTRQFAKWSSLGGIAMSLAGNGLYHLIVALKLTTWTVWPLIVVAVSCIPALQLGLVLHLAALVTRDRAQVDTEPVTEWVVGPDSQTVMSADKYAALVDAQSTGPVPDGTSPSPDTAPDTTTAPKRTRRAPAKRTAKAGKKVDTATAVKAVRVQHPDWTFAAIAAHLNVSTKTVSRHLSAPDIAVDSEPRINGTPIPTEV